MIGVNLSGAEFGTGSRYGYDYVYPSAKDVTYYANAGVDIVRLPFKWERMQPDLNGALDAAELGRMKTFLDTAANAGIKVIVDLHNYGRYDGAVLGSATVTSAAFADFWKKMAGALKDHPAIQGYDLMNEPHDMGGAGRWPTAAQAAVNAIRQVDSKHAIYVEGEGWAGAHTWPTSNPLLDIKDPANNFFYEAHSYFDKNNSGTYAGGYDQEGAHPNTGVDRLKPFVDWLEARGAKGFIGEFAVPDNDPRWLPVLDNFMTAMKAHGLDGTYWGAGAWWGNYPMALVGPDGQPNPQMAVLLKHVDDVAVPQPGPVTPAPLPAPGDGPAPSSIVGTDAEDTLTGTAAADRIEGRGGKDKIDGRAGADSLYGGGDSDIYMVDNSGDRVIELAGQGTDTVNSYVHFTLGSEVEHLNLRGSAALNGTGNGLANRIEGNDGVNLLTGGAGNDILVGRGGADKLVGGSGRDIFDFNNVSDSRATAGDQILDFVKGEDRIDLSTIDANARLSGNQMFAFIGTAGFHGVAGELRYVAGSAGAKIHADVNGDGVADLMASLNGYTGTLASSDFLL